MRDHTNDDAEALELLCVLLAQLLQQLLQLIVVVVCGTNDRPARRTSEPLQSDALRARRTKRACSRSLQSVTSGSGVSRNAG